MIERADDGLVIDFSPNRYTACLASDVVKHQGDRRALDRIKRTASLGQILGHDFLDCKIGTPGLFLTRLCEADTTTLTAPPSIVVNTTVAEER
jgi:hypothetical protein